MLERDVRREQRSRQNMVRVHIQHARKARAASHVPERTNDAQSVVALGMPGAGGGVLLERNKLPFQQLIDILVRGRPRASSSRSSRCRSPCAHWRPGAFRAFSEAGRPVSPAKQRSRRFRRRDVAVFRRALPG